MYKAYRSEYLWCLDAVDVVGDLSTLSAMIHRIISCTYVHLEHRRPRIFRSQFIHELGGVDISHRNVLEPRIGILARIPHKWIVRLKADCNAITR